MALASTWFYHIAYWLKHVAYSGPCTRITSPPSGGHAQQCTSSTDTLLLSRLVSLKHSVCFHYFSALTSDFSDMLSRVPKGTYTLPFSMLLTNVEDNPSAFKHYSIDWANVRDSSWKKSSRTHSNKKCSVKNEAFFPPRPCFENKNKKPWKKARKEATRHLWTSPCTLLTMHILRRHLLLTSASLYSQCCNLLQSLNTEWAAAPLLSHKLLSKPFDVLIPNNII